MNGHIIGFALQTQMLELHTKQIAPCVSTGRELSHHRISSTYSKVRVTLQKFIKHSGNERVKPLYDVFDIQCNIGSLNLPFLFAGAFSSPNLLAIGSSFPFSSNSSSSCVLVSFAGYMKKNQYLDIGLMQPKPAALSFKCYWSVNAWNEYYF